MRIVDGTVCWSATDLTTAATCEHAVLRALDERLGRGDPRPEGTDPLLEQIARIGDLHEAEIRSRLEAGARRLVDLQRPAPGASEAELRAMHATTVRTLQGDADVVSQAGFFDGELIGFADFLLSTPEGWVVADAKLARQARPTALLQLGAYADQLERSGVPVAPSAKLMLGDGTEETFPLGDVLPVFRERRARLRQLIADHRRSGEPVRWGDDSYVACGRCPDCQAAVERHRDVLLVAGVRMTQRKRLREVGVRTIDDLAALPEAPDAMPTATFEKLVAQARLQVAQLDGGPVRSELVDGGRALAMLPAPSPGDIFFDFEGDPLHREADPKVWGLEYLWGVIEAPAPGEEPRYRRWWAHDRAAEKRAFVGFMDYVAARRAEHPEMHVYHYAPYETTALKRLAGRYATHQTELDDLLRSAVFVDLYATVRGSVRVSQPSYSIKKLEPLYMGEDRAGMEVQAGDASVAEYHEAMALRDDGKHEEVEQRLAALEAYNRYDCLSTLELRDWLLGLAETAHLAEEIEPVVVEEAGAESEESDRTVLRLRERSGPEERTERTDDEQCYAMLASAVGFHRRESLPFWWEHFSRLATPDLHDWRPDRDVFRVDSHEVLEEWHVPERRQVLHRRLLLRGSWGGGSTPGSRATVVYRVPCPEGHQVPEKCGYGWMADRTIAVAPDDEGEVVLLETVKKGAEPFDAVPVALVPAMPPPDGLLKAAIREVAERVAEAPELPAQPALDILRRLPPRLTGESGLPHTGNAVDDLVEALLRLDRSYVPVQGPPGTGKTWTGSRVIKRLVEDHGWRVGVVSQGHAVVENMLAAICEAGLDPSLVGKKDTRNKEIGWVDLDGKQGRTQPKFLETHAATGCVIGGTAWTFTGQNAVERESLDLLVIDEAGQFALANTIAVSVAARRLLLLGDPQQLPQVSQGTHDEPVDESALGWVMGRSETLPRELGYFLATTYRMHPALCEKVSRLSYGGELHAADCTKERLLEGVTPGLETVVVEGAFGNSSRSEEEAAVVVDRVERLLGTTWHDRVSPRPLGEPDILVVAPYNAQVSLLRQRLRAAGHGAVRVGTVDKFQGQEAPVVLVSMTASSPHDVPRGMGFLLNRNRVNVAISRAQWLAVLVRSKELTSCLPSSPEQLLELGGFIGLSEQVQPPT
ncbi:MAG TPA: TM0106 family RecB-like putative nuclease [Marmoricola sp.]|nr:TM0106 family RecB-like putative nuclease [Marmoricola sp.]